MHVWELPDITMTSVETFSFAHIVWFQIAWTKAQILMVSLNTLIGSTCKPCFQHRSIALRSSVWELPCGTNPSRLAFGATFKRYHIQNLPAKEHLEENFKASNYFSATVFYLFHTWCHMWHQVRGRWGNGLMGQRFPNIVEGINADSAVLLWVIST